MENELFKVLHVFKGDKANTRTYIVQHKKTQKTALVKNLVDNLNIDKYTEKEFFKTCVLF